jgi:hypothetical protein
MPRYAGQNLASINPEFRKAHNLDSAGKRSTRYTYGKNVLIAAGNKVMANGLCLRLLPVNDENSRGNFVSFREGQNNEAFGDWGRLMTCANWVGNPGVCFVIHDGNPEVNMYHSPYHVLRNVAYNSKEVPGIGRLFTELLSPQKQLDSHIGALAKPDKILFISASTVYVNEHGQVVLGAFTDDQDHDARIIGLKFSAATALYNALSVMDASGEYASGDMLSLGPAKLITILPESFKDGQQPKVMGVGTAGPETFYCPKYARGQQGQYIVGYPKSRSDFTHFAFLHDSYQNQAISLENHVDSLLADTKSWDDRVYVPSYEEQASLIAPAFPREALEYAWREHPDYLRTLSKGTTTSAPAAMSDDDEEEAVTAAFSQRPAPVQRPAAKPAPQDPPAPWDAAAGELSPEEEAGVVDMFSMPAEPAPAPVKAPAVPAGALTSPPPAPAAKPAAASSSADILARARAKAAAAKR